ncbi:MAG: UvrD-helicase domain-containing protein [Candidatus Saccharimonas sp.]
MDVLEGLNEAQRSAVETTSGPLLILAGAGSGKTKTLTHRIAYLMMHEQLLPTEILAVTFTNKAAREMRERLARLVGQPNSRGFMPWMGTFHGICVRFLREYGAFIDISSNFVIYDEDDRRGLVKQAMKQLSINADQIKPRSVSAAISSAKNDLINPADYSSNASYPREKIIARVYELYEKLRQTAGALDFDDLLIETVRLLRNTQDIRLQLRRQFKHILIDEYQDTNAAQYAIVKLLVNDAKNICVVGDDWQSIYSWRGADFKNILNFEKDFPGAVVVKLEQNYRSTGSILAAAQNVITKNIERTDKKLWTSEGNGSPVQVHPVYDESEEAFVVANHIASQVSVKARRYSDFVVLYRTNVQSFAFERACLQQHLPYQLVGGVRFYDRKEIKDIVAYLRLLFQPNDRMSFSRIVNVPKRALGATSLEKFLIWQANSSLDIISSLINAEQASGLTPRARKALIDLGQALRIIQAKLRSGAGPSEIIEQLVKQIGYREYLLDGTPQAEEREANVGTLIGDAKSFVTLPDFLEEVALMSSADKAGDGDKVTLMTLHAAKGLEFPVVYMVGMEEGLFPSMRALEEGPRQLEEERRLCYVGMTRAREELHLLYARNRMQYGARNYTMPSRFLEDMGHDLMIQSDNSFEQSTPEAHNEYGDFVMNFDIGDRVQSQQFGQGEVIDIDGMAVSVRFDGGATKKLNVEYARLELL